MTTKTNKLRVQKIVNDFFALSSPGKVRVSIDADWVQIYTSDAFLNVTDSASLAYLLRDLQKAGIVGAGTKTVNIGVDSGALVFSCRR